MRGKKHTETARGRTFRELVVRAALSIPPGRVSTYGRIARAAGGGARAAQSVTSILSEAKLPAGTSIPYHRIVYADGRVWLSASHRAKRMKLYAKEGIEIDKNDRIKNFVDVLYDF